VTARQLLVVLLVVAVLVAGFRPARAEAMDPLIIVAIAGAAVLVVVIIGVVVIANMEGHKRAELAPATPGPTLVAYVAPVSPDAP
jgi:hypothetical protein